MKEKVIAAVKPKWIYILSLFIFMLIIFSPIAFLVIDAIKYGAANKIDILSYVIPSGRRLTLLLNSIKLSFGVSVFGAFIGMLIASILWKWNSKTGYYLRWFVLISVPIPPYIHALSWNYFFLKLNSILEMINLSKVNFSGYFASCWVQIMAYLPIAIALTLIGFGAVNREMIESGKILRTDIDVFFKIILPLSSSYIIAGGGILFLLSIVDYEVSSLFGVNVYSLEIFAEFSADNEPATAFLLALPVLLICLFLVYFSQTGIRNAMLSNVWRTNRNKQYLLMPDWFKVIQGSAFIVFAAQMAVPALMLCLQYRIWANMFNAFKLSQKEIGLSITVALLAVIVCTPLSMVSSKEMQKSTKLSRFWWLLNVVPLAVPAPLVGIGIIYVFNNTFLRNISDSIAMLVLGVVIRFTPFASMILLAQLKRIDRNLLDIAQILQTNPMQTALKVKLPLMLPGIISAACLTFVLSIGELGASLLLTPPGKETLTVKIYNYMHYGASDTVAGLCLMIMLAVWIMGLFLILALGVRNKKYEGLYYKV